MRESATASCQETKGYVYKFDYTVHVTKIRDLVDLIKKEFKSENLMEVVGFGHVGDGKTLLIYNFIMYNSLVSTKRNTLNSNG